MTYVVKCALYSLKMGYYMMGMARCCSFFSLPPQTDGLVEHFHQMLKRMLRQVVHEEERNWDLLLSYVLFAVREMPQASSDFTPTNSSLDGDLGRPQNRPLSRLEHKGYVGADQLSASDHPGAHGGRTTGPGNNL